MIKGYISFRLVRVSDLANDYTTTNKLISILRSSQRNHKLTDVCVIWQSSQSLFYGSLQPNVCHRVFCMLSFTAILASSRASMRRKENMNTVCSRPSIVDAADTTHRLEGYLSLYNTTFRHCAKYSGCKCGTRRGTLEGCNTLGHKNNGTKRVVVVCQRKLSLVAI